MILRYKNSRLTLILTLTLRISDYFRSEGRQQQCEATDISVCRYSSPGTLLSPLDEYNMAAGSRPTSGQSQQPPELANIYFHQAVNGQARRVG